MKKNLVLTVCLFILTVPVFSQAITKTQYAAIDPFDYKLDEFTTRTIGTARKYKSVVEFTKEIKNGNTVTFSFISLEKDTILDLKIKPGIKTPSPGQTVTVYYSATKGNRTDVLDDRVLDDWEDNKNKADIGAKKSAIVPSTIKKDDYTELSADGVRDSGLMTQEDDEDKIRKLKCTMQFESQEGILYKFSRAETNADKLAIFVMTARRRYPPFAAGKKAVVYFTAIKEGSKENLYLDDIEVID